MIEQLPPKPTQIQVAGVIKIMLLPNGEVVVQAQVPNPLLALGMLEYTKHQLIGQFEKAAEGPKVEAAPPGMVIQ